MGFDVRLSTAERLLGSWKRHNAGAGRRGAVSLQLACGEEQSSSGGGDSRWAGEGR